MGTTTFIGAPHHAGPSLANEGPPCLPTEPIRTEDPDAFRRRMEEKATVRRLQLRAVTPEPRPTVDEDLQAVKFDPLPLRNPGPSPRPVPTPRPRRQPAPQDEAARLDALESYERGESLASLTKRLGVPEAHIRRWLDAAGVKLRTRAESISAALALRDGERVRPCAGGCGRSTRPGSAPADRFPGTSPRVRDGLCGACANPGANRRETTPAERAEWARLHVDEGRTVPEIAERVGRSQWAVRHGLREHGVQIRSGNAIQAQRRAAGAPDAAPPPPASRKSPVIVARNEQLVAMAVAEPHTPVRVLAQRFAVTEATVYNVLANAGVKRRAARAAHPANPTPRSRPHAAPSAPAPLSSPPRQDDRPAEAPPVTRPAAAGDLPAAYTTLRAAVVDATSTLLDAAATLSAAAGHLSTVRVAVLDVLAAIPNGDQTA